MSLTSALADLYRRLEYQTAPDATVTTRLTAFLNEAQQDIVGELGGSRLLEASYPLTSVANQAEYGLGAGVARIRSVRDTANQWALQRVTEVVYRRWMADPSVHTGRPVSFAELGFYPVQAQPSNASELFLKSTSAGDVQVAYYEIVDSSGIVKQGNVTLTGATAVSLSSALTTITQVVDLYLASAAVGVVSLYEDSGVGTLLSSIYTGHTREQFTYIGFLPTPSDAFAYQVDFLRDATDLVNGTDDFPLPVPFKRAAVARALSYEYTRLGDQTRYALVLSEYRRELGLLNHYLVSPPDQVYIPGRRGIAPSNLPASFPWSGYRQ